MIKQLNKGDIVSWKGRDRLGDQLVIVNIYEDGTAFICNNAGSTFDSVDVKELKHTYKPNPQNPTFTDEQIKKVERALNDYDTCLGDCDICIDNKCDKDADEQDNQQILAGMHQANKQVVYTQKEKELISMVAFSHTGHKDKPLWDSIRSKMAIPHQQIDWDKLENEIIKHIPYPSEYTILQKKATISLIMNILKKHIENPELIKEDK
jgi:hypothetical protein